MHRLGMIMKLEVGLMVCDSIATSSHCIAKVLNSWNGFNLRQNRLLVYNVLNFHSKR